MNTAQRNEERAERATTAGRGVNPPSVIRGEEAQRAKVDWLNATFQAPPFSVEAFVALLGRMIGRPMEGIPGGGMLGFETRVDLWTRVGSQRVPFGCIAYGGAAQMGRWMLQLPGHGCGLVNDWPEVAALLSDLDARITRLDLAVDFLAGEVSVDDAVEWYAAHRFTFDGRMAPASEVAGDWIGRERGRTFYVGKRANGKMCRVYEKGRQLGDPLSEWVRIEVQFGNRDREIPFEALEKRDAYFAGAYPVLAEVLDDAEPERIATYQAAGEVSLAKLLHHMKLSYGRLCSVVASLQVDPATLVEAVTLQGVPRRVQPSSVAAGVAWADVLARMKGLK